MNKSKKKNRKKRRAKYRTLRSLTRLAAKLEHRLPLSEQWFRTKWVADGMELKGRGFHDDKYNFPFYPYIPDVINFGYKYIIEIDGGIHNTDRARARDARRDKFLRRHGYTVLRVIAFHEPDYLEVLEKVKSIRVCVDANPPPRVVIPPQAPGFVSPQQQRVSQYKSRWSLNVANPRLCAVRGHAVDAILERAPLTVETPKPVRGVKTIIRRKSA